MQLKDNCLHAVEFLASLDNLLMEITPNQVIPPLVPAKGNCTFSLLHPGWCYEKTHFLVVELQELYHLLEFPAVFALINRGYHASLEEAFIVTLMKLATGDSNVEYVDTFAFWGTGWCS
jgi:hypothetical protein